MHGTVQAALGGVTAGLVAVGSGALAGARSDPPETPSESSSRHRPGEPTYRAVPLAAPADAAAGAAIRDVVVNDRRRVLVSLAQPAAPDRSCYIADRGDARWVSVPTAELVGGTVTAMTCHDFANDGTVVGSVTLADGSANGSADRSTDGSTDGSTVAVAWLRGRTPIRLTTPSGAQGAVAQVTDSRGTEFAGRAMLEYHDDLVRWDRTGAITAQVDPGGMDTRAFVHALADNGDAVGELGFAHGIGDGWIWQGSAFTSVQPAPGMYQGRPTAISPNGRHIVGRSWDYHLAEHPRPDVATEFDRDGTARALPEGTLFAPTDVSDRNRIVGRLGDGTPYGGAPYLWWQGRLFDLNAVTVRPGGMTLKSADSINRAHDIGAVATLAEGGERPVLLDARR